MYTLNVILYNLILILVKVGDGTWGISYLTCYNISQKRI